MYAEQLKQKEFLRNLVSIPDIITLVSGIIETDPENAAMRIGYLMLQYAIVHSEDAREKEKTRTEQRIFNMEKETLLNLYECVQIARTANNNLQPDQTDAA